LKSHKTAKGIFGKIWRIQAILWKNLANPCAPLAGREGATLLESLADGGLNRERPHTAGIVAPAGPRRDTYLGGVSGARAKAPRPSWLAPLGCGAGWTARREV
jgi:hypothetical protein